MNTVAEHLNIDMTGQPIVDNLDALMQVLPPQIREAVDVIGRRDDLLEVILDLGRVPTARYTDGEVVLMEREVAQGGYRLRRGAGGRLRRG